MKNKNNEQATYVSPIVEVIEVEVERGFAASNGNRYDDDDDGFGTGGGFGRG